MGKVVFFSKRFISRVLEFIIAVMLLDLFFGN